MEKLQRNYKNIVAVLFLLLLGFGMGFLIISQGYSNYNSARSLNPITPLIELKETQQNLEEEQKLLKEEIEATRSEILSKEEVLKNTQQEAEVLVDEINSYRELLGMTRVEGAGVIVDLRDASGGEDLNEIDRAISHSTDILDVINVMWEAGAEAVAVNNERIVSSTAIVCVGNNVLINNTPKSSPWTIAAVGDRGRIISFLQDESKLPSIYERNKKYGLSIRIIEAELELPSYSGGFATDHLMIVKEL